MAVSPMPTLATVGTVAGLACGVAWLAYRAWTETSSCPNVETSDNPVKQGFSMKKVPDNLDVIVIGSGTSGLATAAILAKEGKRVLVLEQHDVAGGNLHTFTGASIFNIESMPSCDGVLETEIIRCLGNWRKGYEFDTGLHYIGGKIGEKRSNVRKLLDYITDEDIEWEQMDDAYDVAVSGTEKYHFYSGWTKLKKELKERFPEEAAAIDAYFEMVRRTGDYAVPLLLLLKMLPEPAFNVCTWLFSRQLALCKKTTKQVLESLTKNRKLMGVLSYHYGDYGEAPERGAFAMNALIASHYRAGAYYPIGGPLKIALSIARLIEKYGGKVLVRATVDEVLVDDNNYAYGVVVNGRQILATSIVSSVGMPATMTKLVPESHRHLVSRHIEGMREPEIASNISLMSMFVGIKDTEGVLELPKSNYWIHRSWDHDANMAEYRKDGTKVPCFFISFSSAKDPSYAARHPGKHVALVVGPCFFDDVARFQNDRVKHRGTEYASMKAAWQETFMKALLDQFPALRDRIDFVDFGTAVTNDFYLGTQRGAVYGLAHTPRRFGQHWLRSKTPIRNLFVTGQDTSTCGVCGALVGGYLCAYAMSSGSLLRTLPLWI